jgi:outer membrane protein assembly factor BamB
MWSEDVSEYNATMFRTAIIVAISFLGPALAQAEDWPTYAHDNQRTGVTAEGLSLPLGLMWVFEPAFLPAEGWPLNVNGYGAYKTAPNVNYDDAYQVTAVGEIAYIAASGENRVYAIDVKRGRVLWTFTTEAAPRLAPTIWEGRAYVGSDDGRVHCLDAITGKSIWEFNAAISPQRLLGYDRFGSIWPVRAGVMVDDGVAYFTAGLFPSEGIYLFAVDAGTGKLKYRRPLGGTGNDGPSPQGYPLADNESIYLTSRIDPTRWRKDNGERIPFATPNPNVNKSHEYRFYRGGSYAQLWDDRIVFGQAAQLAYDPAAAWKDKYGREQHGTLAFNWFNARRIAFPGDLAIVATDYHVLAVPQNQLGKMAETICREFEEAYKKHRVATCEEGLAEIARYGADTERGKAIQNGSLRWALKPYQEKWPAVSQALFAKFAAQSKWMTPLKANDVMVVAGDNVFVGGEESVVVLSLDTGKILGKSKTGSRVRGLAVANGRLFVSTIDGKVRCFKQGIRSKNTSVVRQAVPSPARDPRYEKIADEILQRTTIRDGYCLIVGGGDGQLAAVLARKSRLQIEVVDGDRNAIDTARAWLASEKLYGGRISITSIATDSIVTLPYPPFNFNLVIDQRTFTDDALSAPIEELVRVTRPQGGQLVLGATPTKTPHYTLPSNDIQTREWTTSLSNKILFCQRHKQPGTTNWTHNYANAANTYCSEDTASHGPFGVLWYGNPGPRKRIDRHSRGPLPLVVDGIALLTGYDLVMAYDVYNGRKYWERWIPGATRTDLPAGTSNLAADEQFFYVVINDQECLQLDRLTGKTRARFRPPELVEHAHWGWIAREGNLLLGSQSRHDERRRQASHQIADGLFAIEIDGGKTAWIYQGGGVEQDGIAVADGKVFFVDRKLTTAEKRVALENTVNDNKAEERSVKRRVDRRGNPIEPDLGKLVAVNLRDGSIAWQQPFNFSDIMVDNRVVGQRTGIVCMVKDNVVVVTGIGSIGHPYQEFKMGEFARRAMYAFDATSGKLIWGGSRNYRKRPIIVGDYIYAEPSAWHLKTGIPRLVTNPLTGEQTPMNFLRGYSGCDHLLASATCIFGNSASGGFAHYNLDEQTGYTPMGGMSLACNTGAVPANGLFVAPEGRSGCVCSFGIQTSLVLYPRQQAQSWGFSSRGQQLEKLTPVKHVAVNLGAPGFRTDDTGRLWLPYAGQNNVGGAFGKWLPRYRHQPHSFSYRQAETDRVANTPIPWVFSSHYHDTKELRFTLLDEGKGKYTIRLYFTEPDELKSGQRVFDVQLQGKTVSENLDIVAVTGGRYRPLVKTFRGVEIDRDLRITLKVQTGMPVLCGFEATRED